MQTAPPTNRVCDLRTIVLLISQKIMWLDVQLVDGSLFFWFDKAKSDPLINQYLSGEPILVDIHDLWRGMDTFKAVLNNLKRTHG